MSGDIFHSHRRLSLIAIEWHSNEQDPTLIPHPHPLPRVRVVTSQVGPSVSLQVLLCLPFSVTGLPLWISVLLTGFIAIIYTTVVSSKSVI